MGVTVEFRARRGTNEVAHTVTIGTECDLRSWWDGIGEITGESKYVPLDESLELGMYGGCTVCAGTEGTHDRCDD